MKRLFIIWGMVLLVSALLPGGAWGEEKPVNEPASNFSQQKSDKRKSTKAKEEKTAKPESPSRLAQIFPASARSEDKQAAPQDKASSSRQKLDKRATEAKAAKSVYQTENTKVKSAFNGLFPQKLREKKPLNEQQPPKAGIWSTSAEKGFVAPKSKGLEQPRSAGPIKSSGKISPVSYRASDTESEAETRSNATTSGRKGAATNTGQSQKDKVYAPEDAWLFPQKPENQRISVPNLKAENFRTKVQRENLNPPRERKGDHPVIVNRPGDKKVTVEHFDRRKNSVVRGHFDTIHRRFGEPRHDFYYLPRAVNIYANAYRKGYREGFRDGVHYVPSWYDYGRPVWGSFYFGFYFDDPNHLDFWYAGYHPSIYHYYGWVPRWCRAPSIVVYNFDPYPYFGQRPVYYYYYGTSEAALDWTGAQEALRDLSKAWEQSDIDYFANYLREGENISIYFGNEYSYSLPAEDFYAMTLDAMSTVNTLSLEFDAPIWLNVNEFFITGRQIFVNPDNQRQTVYLSYRLHRYGGQWYIIATGSSPQPIEHDYKDFRYR